jgi:DNA repair protein RecN (Recombination protein N)
MLQKLSIQNYILIKELVIEPHKGMNVVTGETGAGKSILLGAIGLLKGQRADVKTLLDESQKCVIEGLFSLQANELQPLFEEHQLDYENPCTVRREISPSGKSRAFVNDTPVNLDQLADIVGELLDIHSQHETILLKKRNYQLQVLDDYAQNTSLRTDYQAKFKACKEAEKRVEELTAFSKSNNQELDYLLFVHKELEEAQLEPGEQDKLEEEQSLLTNSSDIKEKLAQANLLLDGEGLSLLSGLQSLSSLFDHLADFSQEYHTIKEKLASIRFELRDINRQIESMAERTEMDPARLQMVQEKLDIIYKLERKHGVNTIEDLLSVQENFAERLLKMENVDSDLAEAKLHWQEAERQRQQTGKQLSDSRKAVVLELEKAVVEKLVLLGMPNASFQIQIQEQTPQADGLDKVVFMFSANKGIPARPMTDVASGGEFSRLMLTLKYLLASKQHMPTLIFDEIDAGISGEVAHNVAELIESMAQKHQVFTITHLPQMASKGSAHFFVYKDHSTDRTTSHIRRLNEEERVTEIAKMVGGKEPSASALQSAKEMLGLG